MRVQIGNVALDLTADQVEDLRQQLAVEVTEKLDAAAVAKRLGVSREYVYDHAEELGGERLGSGPKSPWRYDPAKLEGANSTVPADIPARPTRRRRREGAAAGLLEIRGMSPYAA